MTGSYDGLPLRYAVSGSSSFDGAFAYDGSNPIYYEGGTNAHAGSPRAHWGYLCKANPSQNSSPTSTLVGHSHSPPPLSPPLSPSDSPPMSPDSPTSWPGSVNYSMSPRYQKTSTAGNVNNLQVQLSSGSFSSLSAWYQNSVSATTSLGITSPARRLEDGIPGASTTREPVVRISQGSFEGKDDGNGSLGTADRGGLFDNGVQEGITIWPLLSDKGFQQRDLKDRMANDMTKEVKLWNDKYEREMYDNFADLFAIIRTMKKTREGLCAGCDFSQGL